MGDFINIWLIAKTTTKVVIVLLKFQNKRLNPPTYFDYKIEQLYNCINYIELGDHQLVRVSFSTKLLTTVGLINVQTDSIIDE